MIEKSLPLVSVVMPLYNSEKYVKATLESILQQTYTNFEFLIFDDASTDKSREIVESYSDPRIVLISQEKNTGYVPLLNQGIARAKGVYIARMDSDDIALPDRFKHQVAYLESHPECAIVASLIRLMSQDGEVQGSWNENEATLTSAQIKQYLPNANCIAHPTIMARTEVLREYLYDPRLNAVEDYELWLRLCGDGKQLAKLNEVLLHYRIHPQSVSQIASRKNPYDRLVRAKLSYLKKRKVSRFVSMFNLKVALFLLRDMALFYSFSLKKKLHS